MRISLRPNIVSIGSAVVVAVVALQTAFLNHSAGNDFAVFHKAGAAVLTGEVLYDRAVFMIYKYAPSVALLFAPLGFLSLRAAYIVFTLLSAVAVIMAMRLAAERVEPNERPLAQIGVLLLTIAYTQLVFGLGQVETFLLLSLVYGEHIRTKSPFLSGVLIGLPTLFKPPYLLFPALLVLSREWRRLAGVVTIWTLGFLVPVLRWGVGGALAQTRAWISVLSESTAEVVCRGTNQSVYAMACLAGEPGTPTHWGVALGLAALFALTCLVFVFRTSAAVSADKRQWSYALGWMVAWPATVILSPLGWRANLIMIIPFLFALWSALAAPYRYYAMAPLGLIAVVNPELLGRANFEAVLMYRPLGFAVWACIVITHILLYRLIGTGGASFGSGSRS